MTDSAALLEGYEAALSRVAYHRFADPGYIRLTGETRQDFLHRQTTNDMNRLTSGQAVSTVITSPTARIIDVLTVLAEDENSYGLITADGYAESTTAFLKGKIFFMDRVSAEDISGSKVQLELFGPALNSVLGSAGIVFPHESEHVVHSSIESVPVTMLGVEYFTGTGVRLIASIDDAQALETSFHSLGLEKVSASAYETLRVEYGLPASGTELTDDFTPLEVGLDRLISDSKGCYTGQEIIARQITYDKVTKRLVGLLLPSEVAAGSSLRANGKPAGKVTSVVNSPRFGWIALAVLKRDGLDQPNVSIVDSSETEIVAEIQPLPFE